MKTFILVAFGFAFVVALVESLPVVGEKFRSELVHGDELSGKKKFEWNKTVQKSKTLRKTV